MAPTPVTHPLRDRATARLPLDARARAMALHPSAATVPVPSAPSRPRTPVVADDVATDPTAADVAEEAGSMTTEYGLLIVVGATITSLVIRWASGGAVFELLGGVMNAARGLVGA